MSKTVVRVTKTHTVRDITVTAVVELEDEYMHIDEMRARAFDDVTRLVDGEPVRVNVEVNA